MEHYGMRFKEMDKKQKVKHIWEYYRYHILATIIAVAVIGALGKSILFPPPADEVDIMLAGQMYLDTNSTEVAEQFKEEFQTGLDFNNMSWDNDPQIASVMFQKIPLLITTNELDIMAIADTTFEKFTQIYGKDMFMPLEEVPELKDLLEKYKDQLFTCDKAIGEKGELVDAQSHVYGIKVKQFSHLPCIINSEEMIVGLNPKAKDFEKSISMLKYILE